MDRTELLVLIISLSGCHLFPGDTIQMIQANPDTVFLGTATKL
jgi:hypothetical protein